METPEPVGRWARRAFQMGCMSTLLVGIATHARAFEATSAGSMPSPLTALVTTAIIAVVIAGIMALLKRAGHEGPALPHPARRSSGSQPLRAPIERVAAPRTAALGWASMPELEPIPYDGVMTKFAARHPDPVPPAAPAAKSAFVRSASQAPVPGTEAPNSLKTLKTTSLSDATRQRILERYIGARFTGVASRGEDFLDAPRIVKAARLFFEDHQIERAVELLQLATDVNPGDEAPRLAMLEILFLGTDPAGYARAARRFASGHPQSSAWPQIRQLGLKLGLDDAVITEGLPHVESHPNYGPWSGLPNWIQAPWDLTGDVALAELHARLKNDSAIANEDTRRRAA